MLTTQESQGELSDEVSVSSPLKNKHIKKGARLSTIQESFRDINGNTLNGSEIVQSRKPSFQIPSKEDIIIESKNDQTKSINKKQSKEEKQNKDLNSETRVTEIIRKKKILALSNFSEKTQSSNKILADGNIKDLGSQVGIDKNSRKKKVSKVDQEEENDKDDDSRLDTFTNGTDEAQKRAKIISNLSKKVKRYPSQISNEGSSSIGNDSGDYQPEIITKQKSKKKKVDFKEDLHNQEQNMLDNNSELSAGNNERKLSLKKRSKNSSARKLKVKEQIDQDSLKVHAKDKHEEEIDEQEQFIDNDENNSSTSGVREYEISWSFLKFFRDKRIRIQEKILLLFSFILILSDIACSIKLFVDFNLSDCFGYENEEITNTLPGNIQLPFLVPTAIMGVVPNLQLNQFVYSFSSCKSLNPIITNSFARVVTQILCYAICSVVLLICVLLLACSFHISRQTWKRIKNIGFYIISGLFLLSFVFLFIFASVIQLGNEPIPGLITDNITFWSFFLISLCYSIMKITCNRQPFPFIPEVVNLQSQASKSIAQEDNKINSHILIPLQDDQLDRQDTQGPLVIDSNVNNSNSNSSNSNNSPSTVPIATLQKRVKKKIIFSESNIINNNNSTEFDISKNLSLYSNASHNNNKLLYQSGSQRRVLLNLEALKTGEDSQSSILQDQSNNDAATAISISQQNNNKKSIFSQKRIRSPLKSSHRDNQDQESINHDDTQSKEDGTVKIPTKRNRITHSTFTYDSVSISRSTGSSNIDNNIINQEQNLPHFAELQTSTVNISSQSIPHDILNCKRDQELFNLNVNHRHKRSLHNSIVFHDHTNDPMQQYDENNTNTTFNVNSNINANYERSRSLNKMQDNELPQHCKTSEPTTPTGKSSNRNNFQ